MQPKFCFQCCIICPNIHTYICLMSRQSLLQLIILDSGFHSSHTTYIMSQLRQFKILLAGAVRVPITESMTLLNVNAEQIVITRNMDRCTYVLSKHALQSCDPGDISTHNQILPLVVTNQFYCKIRLQIVGFTRRQQRFGVRINLSSPSFKWRTIVQYCNGK